LQTAQAISMSAFEEIASQLTETRKHAAVRLSRSVEKDLGALAMERTVFRVDVEPGEWSESGADTVRFLVSANRGEEAKPMERIASGGEVSRIALALKSCLVESQVDGSRKTLVFDEVDTGVGGSAAEGVARRLKKLSRSNQVLCVTHLAQVASFADHHFVVEKVEANGRTTSRVVELVPEERRNEVARMISGQTVTREALQHADQLIELASK
jgi:DNA repair protein RecN (Recombination protein N)